MEFIRITSVEQSKNKKYVGRIFKIIRSARSMDGKSCYLVETEDGKKIFNKKRTRKVKYFPEIDNIKFLKGA